MSLLSDFAKGLKKGLNRQCLYCRHSAISNLEGVSLCALHLITAAATFYIKETSGDSNEKVSDFMGVMLASMQEQIIKDLILESEMHSWEDFMRRYTLNGKIDRDR